MRLHSKGKLLSLPATIRLGQKLPTMTNSLADYSTELTAAAKVCCSAYPRCFVCILAFLSNVKLPQLN